jgi:hypothetical protein
VTAARLRAGTPARRRVGAAKHLESSFISANVTRGIAVRAEGIPMSDNLRAYLEEKKAVAERANEPQRLQDQLLKDFARNADAKFKSVLPAANRLSDELSGSAVLGVGLLQTDSLIRGITLQLTTNDKAITYTIEVELMGIHVKAGMPMPITASVSATNPNSHGLHIVFVNAIELSDVNDELISSLVKQMIDKLYS